MQRSSRTDTNEEGLGGSYRGNIFSVIQNGDADQMFFQNGDEVTFYIHYIPINTFLFFFFFMFTNSVE